MGEGTLARTPLLGGGAPTGAGERAGSGLGARRLQPRDRPAVGRRRTPRVSAGEGPLRDVGLREPHPLLAERQPHRLRRPSPVRRTTSGWSAWSELARPPQGAGPQGHRAASAGPRLVSRGRRGLVHRRRSRTRTCRCVPSIFAAASGWCWRPRPGLHPLRRGPHDGRILMGRETSLRHVEALVPGSAEPRDFSIRSNSMTRGLSADGEDGVVVTDQNAEGYAAFHPSHRRIAARAAGRGRRLRSVPGRQVGAGPDARFRPGGSCCIPRGPGPPEGPADPDQIEPRAPSAGCPMAASSCSPTRGRPASPAAATCSIPRTSDAPARPSPLRVSSRCATGRSRPLPTARRVVARDLEGRVAAYPHRRGAPEPISGV